MEPNRSTPISRSSTETGWVVLLKYSTAQKLHSKDANIFMQNTLKCYRAS